MLKWTVSLAFFLFIANATAAIEKQVVCAKYRTHQSWSSGHKVEAVIAGGSELNAATMSFNYKAASTYVIIFWDREPAHMIELDLWAALSELGLTIPNKLEGNVIELNALFLTQQGQPGKDQKGREWKISASLTCS